ncbi:unnamed protein product [Discosporangium mesarthrocarpum]
MGSTSQWWGATGQSQVFGGGREGDLRYERSQKRAKDDDHTGGEGRGERRSLNLGNEKSGHVYVQVRNFRLMMDWLGSHAAPGSCGCEHDSAKMVQLSTDLPPTPTTSHGQYAFQRQNRGSIFQTALSEFGSGCGSGVNHANGSQANSGLGLGPACNTLEEAVYDLARVGEGPLALALRLYHARQTWKRLHSNESLPPTTTNTVVSHHQWGEGAPEQQDEGHRVSSAAHKRGTGVAEEGKALLKLGLAVTPLSGSGGGGGGGRGGHEVMAGGAGGSGGEVDPLSILMLQETLSAKEARTLAHTLGCSTYPPGVREGALRQVSQGRPCSGSVGRVGVKGGSQRGGLTGRGRARGGTMTKEEACTAVEAWVSAPETLGWRKRRLLRAVKEAMGLIRGGGGQAETKADSRGERGNTSDIIIRLSGTAREAIRRVHTAFFSAACHGPQDAAALLQADITSLAFGAPPAPGKWLSSSSRAQARGCPGAQSRIGLPPPPVLRSSEVFMEFCRQVALMDGMDLAATAGDSRQAAQLAYEILHDASTALLPSGCPMCRQLHRHRKGTGAAGAEGGGGKGQGQNCSICELSARVVMRGVGLLERERNYDSAFHYLEILLQAPSQRLSVWRPRYWVRLVTDLSHKKRIMEGLRACERALAEGMVGNSTTHPCRPQRVDNDHGGAGAGGGGGRGGKLGTEEEEEEEENKEWQRLTGAAFPLCETLPLMRRAARLTVPPLRWKSRPPPTLQEGGRRVLELDLSWRRPPASTLVKQGPTGRIGLGGPVRGAGEEISNRGSEAGVGPGAGRQSGRGQEREGERKEKDKEESRAGQSNPASGVVPESGITPGTSLEQAVLDSLLVELGPGWAGMHSENRCVQGTIMIIVIPSSCLWLLFYFVMMVNFH